MTMVRDLETLANEKFDLLVVGGGIFGACIARDAALRGLTVALIERDDFGGATSANSFKVVHGGIRYLQHGDVPRVRESCRERRTWLRTAPHLVHPLPIVVPTRGQGLQGRSVLRAGMTAYDLLTADRNRGITDPARRIPRVRFLSRSECLELFPALPDTKLTGAAVFHDAQMYNPPRLTLAVLRSAVDSGAVVANHVEATGFLRDGDRISGVHARDVPSDSSFEIRARFTVNATGPWASRLIEEHLGTRLDPMPAFSRDACFVVPRPIVTSHAVAVQGQSRDPDALVSRGARHLFLAPWRGRTLVGVWHVVHQASPDRFEVTSAELTAFLDEVNSAVPGLDLSLDDIAAWNAGLVLFGENIPGARHLSYGKRSRLVDHATAHGLAHLLTVIGVRYTTAPGIAQRTVDQVLRRLGVAARASEAQTLPVHGGEIAAIDGLVSAVRRELSPRGLDRAAEALARNYGTAYADVLAEARTDPSLLTPLGSSTVLRAEVPHAVRKEMALSLRDVVFGRTDLGTAGYPGDAAVADCAGLMAHVAGWDERRLSLEMTDLMAEFNRRDPGPDRPAPPVSIAGHEVDVR